MGPSSYPNCFIAAPLVRSSIFSEKVLYLPNGPCRSLKNKPSRCTLRCSLSEPFPVSDIFQRPFPSFLPSPFNSPYRADLLGTVLFAVGLYFGFSEKTQWGAALRQFLGKRFGATIGDAVHSLPFFFAGLAIDATFRGLLGPVWALAGGVFLLSWGGVFQAARVGRVDEADNEEGWKVFTEFAASRIRKSGRCHFVDISKAYKDYRGPRGAITDEAIRRLIRKWAPAARRSPNGFYRQLSLVPRRRTKEGKVIVNE